MIIESNENLYETVRELVGALQNVGASEQASDLRMALRFSSMPGEILGEIRRALRRVRDHAAYGEWDIRTRVDEGIAYVDRVLGVFNH